VTAAEETSQSRPLGTIEVDGVVVTARCRIGWDGIEFVGRLFFAEPGVSGDGVPDEGALPGHDPDEVMQAAQRLGPEDLQRRYRRAVAHRRRFRGLRVVTEEILARIRYMNQVALSARTGMLDAEGAAGELELTERQLHDLVDRLRDVAGVPD
jgi:hypothetical protein